MELVAAVLVVGLVCLPFVVLARRPAAAAPVRPNHPDAERLAAELVAVRSWREAGPDPAGAPAPPGISTGLRPVLVRGAAGSPS
jgi:hypothetical protein